MAPLPAIDLTFAEWLREQLDQRGWGIRTLARKMSTEQPEIPRRALNRYMRGSLPTEAYAIAIAEALGVDRAEMPLTEAPLGGPFRRDGSGGSPARARPRTKTSAKDEPEVKAA